MTGPGIVIDSPNGSAPAGWGAPPEPPSVRATYAQQQEALASVAPL